MSKSELTQQLEAAQRTLANAELTIKNCQNILLQKDLEIRRLSKENRDWQAFYAASQVSKPLIKSNRLFLWTVFLILAVSTVVFLIMRWS